MTSMREILRIGRLATTLVYAWWASAAFAASGAGMSAPMVRIALKPQVLVERSDVRLGDIATLSSPNLDVLRRAMSLPLGQAFAPMDLGRRIS